MVCEDKTPHAAGSSQIGGGTRAGHGMRGRSAPRAAGRPVGRREEGGGGHPLCALGPSRRFATARTPTDGPGSVRPSDQPNAPNSLACYFQAVYARGLRRCASLRPSAPTLRPSRRQAGGREAGQAGSRADRRMRTGDGPHRPGRGVSAITGVTPHPPFRLKRGEFGKCQGPSLEPNPRLKR